MKFHLLVLVFVLLITAVGLSDPSVVHAQCPKAGCPTPPTPQPVSVLTTTHFDDGRLNSQDPWETAAIYCMGDGSVRVQVLVNGDGFTSWPIAFTISPADIAKIPRNPSTNTLIIVVRGTRLYRLTNGLLQVNTPGLNPADGEYFFQFPDCPGAGELLPAVQRAGQGELLPAVQR